MAIPFNVELCIRHAHTGCTALIEHCAVHSIPEDARTEIIIS